MRWLFNILVYLSFVFLIIFLYKFDYLSLSQVSFHWFTLMVSVVLLWAGFLMSTISWWNALRVHEVDIRKSKAVESHGMAIFAKYIPGKIWVILGRASSVTMLGYSLKVTSFVSLKEQLIYVWLGLLISVIPIAVLQGFNYYVVLLIALILFFSFILFSAWFHHRFLALLKRIFKKEFDIPLIKLKEVRSIFYYILVYWLLWMSAFYFFVRAITPGEEVAINVAFGFPLSVTLGLLVIFLPGGLGVREAILTGYLVSTGVPLEMATTISVISRLWFITGEVFIFITALFILKSRKMPAN